MATRKIVRINEDKCDGCGQCVIDCAEGALQIIDGKARIVKESYCDGLGACLGSCPQDAITIEEREADSFDEAAVEQHLAELTTQKSETTSGAGLAILECGCPGTAVREMKPPSQAAPVAEGTASQLRHWPVQLTLVPPDAPFLRGAELLLAADCVPFAMPDFHARFLSGRSVLVGCPKLDNPEAYVQKLDAILQQSSIRSLTIIHMEVPCCTGLCGIAKAAIGPISRGIPVREVTVSVDGRVLADQQWEG